MSPLSSLLSVYLGLLLGALAGFLVGLGIQQLASQVGWALTVAGLGACGGSFWAALLQADGKPLWRLRSAASSAEQLSEEVR